MILGDPQVQPDGSIIVVVYDDDGNEIGFNQTFPTEVD